MLMMAMTGGGIEVFDGCVGGLVDLEMRMCSVLAVVISQLGQ